MKVVNEKYHLVTDLILEGNRITATGMEHLVKADWHDLRLLNLSTP